MEHFSIENGALYGSIETAKMVGISLRQLYHWVDHLHLVNPRIERFGLRQFRRFTANDLTMLSEVKTLVERGYTLRASAEIARGERKG